MKPFDLTACIAGKPVVTRDGRPYKFAAYNPDAKTVSQLIGWLDREVFSHYPDGKYFLERETKDDLFMACEEREVWVNVYEDRRDDDFWESEQDAKDRALNIPAYLGTIRLTYRVPDKGEEK